MYTTYKNLPNHSRVWVYQANRAFTENEIAIITKKSTEFVNTWTRHGDDLKGSFTIKYNQFLVLAVDEGFNNVSGCSIDSSVRFIRELEADFNIDLLDKMNVSFKDGEHINLVKLPQFQQFVKEGKITEDTVVFNNMVATKEDLEKNWEVPAHKSWHKRFF